MKYQPLVLLTLVVAAASNPAVSPAGDAAPHHHGSRRHLGNAPRRAADALARREIAPRCYPASDAPASSHAPVPSPPVQTGPGATTPTSPVANPTSQPTSTLASVSYSTPLGPPTSPAPATPTTTVLPSSAAATESSHSALRYLVTSTVPGATPTGGSQQPGTEDMGPTDDRSVAADPGIYVYQGSQKRFHGLMTYYDAGGGQGSCGPVTDEGLTVALDGSLMRGGDNRIPPMCGRYIMIQGPAGQIRAQVMDTCGDPAYCPGTFLVDGSHATFGAVVGPLSVGAALVTWWWAP